MLYTRPRCHLLWLSLVLSSAVSVEYLFGFSLFGSFSLFAFMLTDFFDLLSSFVTAH